MRRIAIDGLLGERAVPTYTEFARLAHVSRAHVSQIMGLLNLAPDLQEHVLFLPRTVNRRDRIRLADLLAIASILDWRAQRRRWRARAWRRNGKQGKDYLMARVDVDC